jgi:hypothetical protein
MVAAVAVLGCEAVQPTANPSWTGSIAPSPAASASPTGFQSPWPTIAPLILGTELTCGGFDQAPNFPASVLNSAPGAENDPDPAAEGLRALLRPRPGLQQSGWRRVVESPSLVLFVAAGPADEPWFQVIMSRTPTGTWQTSGYGGCQLRVVFGPDVGRADLYFDPSRPPSPSDRSVQLLIAEEACSGGASPEGRILAPQLAYRSDAIYVAITIRNRPGEQDCQGVDPSPYALELAEPLGSRALFDATVVPPQRVEPPERP